MNKGFFKKNNPQSTQTGYLPKSSNLGFRTNSWLSMNDDGIHKTPKNRNKPGYHYFRTLGLYCCIFFRIYIFAYVYYIYLRCWDKPVPEQNDWYGFVWKSWFTIIVSIKTVWKQPFGGTVHLISWHMQMSLLVVYLIISAHIPIIDGGLPPKTSFVGTIQSTYCKLGFHIVI